MPWYVHESEAQSALHPPQYHEALQQAFRGQPHQASRSDEEAPGYAPKEAPGYAPWPEILDAGNKVCVDVVVGSCGADVSGSLGGDEQWKEMGQFWGSEDEGLVVAEEEWLLSPSPPPPHPPAPRPPRIPLHLANPLPPPPHFPKSGPYAPLQQKPRSYPFYYCSSLARACVPQGEEAEGKVMERESGERGFASERESDEESETESEGEMDEAKTLWLFEREKESEVRTGWESDREAEVTYLARQVHVFSDLGACSCYCARAGWRACARVCV